VLIGHELAIEHQQTARRRWVVLGRIVILPDATGYEWAVVVEQSKLIGVPTETKLRLA
jgi:hypothetical protein